MSAPASSTQTITHIVLFKYKPTITWSDFETHFDAFRALPHKCLHPVTNRPYMLSMRMGKNRSWEPFGKGMTHAFVLEFASQDDLDYYLTKDPVHRAFSRAAGPLIDDSVVVDIRDGVLFGPGATRPEGVTFPGEEEGKRWKGSCHCGGTEWEVVVRGEGEELKHVLCHCDTCKKLGGGPYSCNYIVPREDLTITKGRPSVYTYKGASGKFGPLFILRRKCCGTCSPRFGSIADNFG
ncbi:hypothetical protein BK809_0004710 [Diplodia seriata]|uniref:Stress-response A/B barrel domain-containing protein n=1 Tax=Diplodia seriata TaxID=420778 RepID=A0A1S8B726_9PEZI|nr:hypothetical protein BK809_0004710 [Diplodia seriata]